jgi:hypothetical protein
VRSAHVEMQFHEIEQDSMAHGPRDIAETLLQLARENTSSSSRLRRSIRPSRLRSCILATERH